MSKATEELRRWFVDEGRLQSWVASQVGVSDATLSRWLSNHRVPIRQHRLALAKVTRLKIADEKAWVDE